MTNQEFFTEAWLEKYLSSCVKKEGDLRKIISLCKPQVKKVYRRAILKSNMLSANLTSELSVHLIFGLNTCCLTFFHEILITLELRGLVLFVS